MNRGDFVTFVYTTNGVELYQGLHSYDYPIYIERQIVPLLEMVSQIVNVNVNSNKRKQIELF